MEYYKIGDIVKHKTHGKGVCIKAHKDLDTCYFDDGSVYVLFDKMPKIWDRDLSVSERLLTCDRN